MTSESIEKEISQKAPIYNQIGRSYDKTRSADPEIVKIICDLLKSHTNGHYLDLGCGSGNYTVALSQLGYQMTGIDISDEMLNKAKAKSDLVKWIKGDARQLPFQMNEFDGATCILATHHIQNLDITFSEIFRVLKPDSHFIIFTSTPKRMQNYWLCHYFPKLMLESCEIMLEEEIAINMLKNAGFSDVLTKPFFVSNTLIDWFLHAGKYRPEIYLDPDVRAGISSFAKMENDPEITTGLKLLKQDIENNNIQTIINKYENNDGDYLFLAAKKI